MSLILITGSADGLGLLAAQSLAKDGHQVVLHARNQARAEHAKAVVPNAADVLVADLADLTAVKQLAQQANALGHFDAVIHNAAVNHAPAGQILAVNVLAPYLLTCLMQKPARLVFLSSGMHLQGHPNFDGLLQNSPSINYSDSKLYITMMAFAVARLWPSVRSNAVDPGWVPTKMGGPNAPDDLQQGAETQAWLAAGSPEATKITGKYLFHKAVKQHNPLADDEKMQDRLIEVCGKFSEVSFPK